MKKHLVLIAPLLVLSALLIVTGCAKKQVVTSEPAPAPAAVTSQETVPEKAEPAVTGIQATVLSEIELFESEKIFFDFDRYDLKPEAREMLTRKAAWLQAHPEFSISIEGNCDERGTTEYNLALGQRRADAAMSYLTTLGIAASRIATVSYGEMQPVAPGHDEASWAQNRRDEFKVMK